MEELLAAIVGDALDDPQSVPDQHPPYPDARRGGVIRKGFLEGPHVLPAPDALARLEHLHDVDWSISMT
jgi:hypothetical protein